MLSNKHGKDFTGVEIAELLCQFATGAPTAQQEAFTDRLTRQEHRTIQQKAMGLIVTALESWAMCFDLGRFDLRNEGTVRLAKKMIVATGDKFDRTLPYI
jgi:hypothetical protein